jgi:phosphate transport system protein
MRSPFQYQLSGLIAQLAQMCVMAGQAMSDATHALLQADIGVADNVILGHRDTAAMGSSAEETAFLLLTSQGAVAADLRSVVSALHIAADAETMAELAVRVAEIARRRYPDHAVPQEVNSQVAEMAALAVAQARADQEVLLSGEPRMPARIPHNDATMEELHRRLLALLINTGWTAGTAAGVDVAVVGYLYARFSHHAVQIARRVISHTPPAGGARTAPTVARGVRSA